MSRQFGNIKTGVIGVGSMGQNHARVYNEISNLVGVFDTDMIQGKKVSERLGIRLFETYEELISEVDAVSISVPTNYHLEVAKAVSSKGVHMLVEKPLAGNIEDANKIQKLAESNNLVLAVGHIERYNPVISIIRKKLKSGVWGKLITMSSKRVSRLPERIKDVGVIFDLGIHDLDILRYLAGSEVKTLYALGGYLEHKNLEDHASILLEFNNGIKSMLEISWLTPMKVRQISLTCTKAYILVDLMNQTIEVSKSEISKFNEIDMSKTDYSIDVKELNIVKKEPLKLELSDFLSSVNDMIFGNKLLLPLVGGKDGIEAVALAAWSLNELNNINGN